MRHVSVVQKITHQRQHTVNLNFTGTHFATKTFNRAVSEITFRTRVFRRVLLAADDTNLDSERKHQ